MKKMHVYDVYLDDGEHAIKVTIPASSKKEAIAYCDGNGKVIAVHDCDLQDIDLDRLDYALRKDRWGQKERDIILRCLDMCGLRRD